MNSAVYDSIVRMPRIFYPVYFSRRHGNFGSVDGGSAAAMRYTEVRLSKICLGNDDIHKNTVDFIPNYDGSEEPAVLPSRVPNLL